MGKDRANREELMAFFNRLYDESFADLARFTAIKCADVNTVSDILQELFRILQAPTQAGMQLS